MSIIKLNNNALSGLTSFTGSASLGDMVFISSATASSSASIEFTSGIDSTYKEYKFFFINIHPQNDDAHFEFNMSTDGGSNYNVTKTSSFFRAFQTQTGGTTGLAYLTDNDLAQGTGFQDLIEYGYNSAESSASGSLQLFDPSNTTFVKHFIAATQYRRSYSSQNHASAINYVGGYGNTTSAVNAIKFQYQSGNIDSGKILLFGLN